MVELLIKLPKVSSERLSLSILDLEERKRQVDMVIQGVRDALEVPEEYVLLVGADGALGFGLANNAQGADNGRDTHGDAGTDGADTGEQAERPQQP